MERVESLEEHEKRLQRAGKRAWGEGLIKQELILGERSPGEAAQGVFYPPELFRDAPISSR